MQYKIYSAEYKLALIEEYKSRNISLRAFVKEKDISLSTFESWLTKIRRYGTPMLRMPTALNDKPLIPIDITSEAKEIIKEQAVNTNNTFTLETKGMKLTFSISNLKNVLEVIK